MSTIVNASSALKSDAQKKIKGTSGRDYIVINGSAVTVEAGAGNDTIVGSTYGDMFLFNYASSNDIITNFGVNDTLKCTSGMIDALETVGHDVVVTITNSKQTKSSKVTLQGASDLKFKISGANLTGVPINYIYNDDDKVKINGTTGKDYIINVGKNATIQSGKGNDTIVGSEFADTYLFSYASGNNVINDFGENDTLRNTSGTMTYKTVGNDIIVSIKKNSTMSRITLKGAGDLELKKSGANLIVIPVNSVENNKNEAKIAGTSGRDYIANTGEDVTIQAGKGNDTIVGSKFADTYIFSCMSDNNVIMNFDEKDTLKSTLGTLSYEVAGDDVIVSIQKNSTVGTVTLKGAGNLELKVAGSNLVAVPVNYIENDKNKMKINGTSGRDYIVNNGERVTITAGKGNDTIVGSDYAETYLFSYASGDDVITNFGRNDTIISMNGSIQGAPEGDDYIVKITKGNEIGTVTLKGVYWDAIRRPHYSNRPIENDEDCKKIVGTKNDDHIVNSGSNVTIQAGKGNDTLTGSDSGQLYLFDYTAGDDIITNFGVNDTLKATTGKIAYSKSGSDCIVTITKNNLRSTIALQGAAQYEFKKSGSSLIIDSVNAIKNEKAHVKVCGTTGRDCITNYGENVTVQAGAGNDTLIGSEFADTYLFSYASGNDLITNFGLNDTLKSTSGTLSYEVAGDDVIVSIQKNSTVGTVTLEGAGAYHFEQKGTALTVGWTPDLIEQLPAEDYWFLKDEAATSDDLKGLLNDDAFDNSTEMSAFEGEALFKNSARIDQMLNLSTSARHRPQK